MKKLFSAFLFSTTILSATYCQTEQGRVGINGSISIGNTSDDRGASSYSFSASPSILYFIADNLALSPSFSTYGTFGNKETGNQRSLSFNLSGGAVYYFGISDWKPFVLGRIGFYTSSNHYSFGDFKYDELLLTAGAGLAYFFTKSTAITGTLSLYYYGHNHEENYSEHITNLTFGITYLLPK